MSMSKFEILEVEGFSSHAEKKRERNVLEETKHETTVGTEIRRSCTSVEPQKEKLPLELRR